MISFFIRDFNWNLWQSGQRLQRSGVTAPPPPLIEISHWLFCTHTHPTTDLWPNKGHATPVAKLMNFLTNYPKMRSLPLCCKYYHSQSGLRHPKIFRAPWGNCLFKILGHWASRFSTHKLDVHSHSFSYPEVFTVQVRSENDSRTILKYFQRHRMNCIHMVEEEEGGLGINRNQPFDQYLLHLLTSKYCNYNTINKANTKERFRNQSALKLAKKLNKHNRKGPGWLIKSLIEVGEGERESC